MMKRQTLVALLALGGLGVLIYSCLYIWPLPQLPLSKPLFLLSPSERTQVCSNQRMAGEIYDISTQGRNIVTPEAALNLQQIVDREGDPSGYITQTAFGDRRCYFLTLFWLKQGYSARSIFLPITEKITPDVQVASLEHFAPSNDIGMYATQMKMDERALRPMYHEWIGIESIVYP